MLYIVLRPEHSSSRVLYVYRRTRRRRLTSAATPAKPMLSNSIVAGSGTIWVPVTTILSKRMFPASLVAPFKVIRNAKFGLLLNSEPARRAAQKHDVDGRCRQRSLSTVDEEIRVVEVPYRNFIRFHCGSRRKTEDNNGQRCKRESAAIHFFPFCEKIALTAPRTISEEGFYRGWSPNPMPHRVSASIVVGRRCGHTAVITI